MTNNQQEKLFSNKFIQNFLDDEPALSLQNKYKFAEIASSLAYYLKTFSNINKLLDYISLVFKHVFNEKIIFIISTLEKVNPVAKVRLVVKWIKLFSRP